jgi:FolB domain-containing protein
MDQIIIKDLLIQGIIGINEEERENPQDILINLSLYTDTRQAAQTDSIEDCVNYDTVVKNVMALVENAKRYTVEALANDIARLCLNEPNVIKVRVRVEKPGAVRFSKSVGVEIERTKIDFIN